MTRSVRFPALSSLVALLLWAPGVMASQPKLVAELFTSLGCSSCPPADAIAGILASSPALLVLSYHVTYWDGPTFADPFALKSSTDRQYEYQGPLRQSTAFTPQFVVNGTQSVVGSDGAEVKRALQSALQPPSSFPVLADLSKQTDNSFVLRLSGPDIKADVWEVRYVRHASTRVRGGENSGHTLETFNNVTHIHRLGAFKPGTLNLPPLKSPDDGLAILIQAPGPGKVLGAAAY